MKLEKCVCVPLNILAQPKKGCELLLTVEDEFSGVNQAVMQLTASDPNLESLEPNLKITEIEVQEGDCSWRAYEHPFYSKPIKDFMPGQHYLIPPSVKIQSIELQKKIRFGDSQRWNNILP